LENVEGKVPLLFFFTIAPVLTLTLSVQWIDEILEVCKAHALLRLLNI